jgi:hypothetical protein
MLLAQRFGTKTSGVQLPQHFCCFLDDIVEQKLQLAKYKLILAWLFVTMTLMATEYSSRALPMQC